MLHKIAITIQAKHGKAMPIDPTHVTMVIDGATGLMRAEDEVPLQERELIRLDPNSSYDTDEFLGIMCSWRVRVAEDPPGTVASQLKAGESGDIQLKDYSYDYRDVVKTAKAALGSIDKRFVSSSSPQDRAFLKKMEMITKGFLEMVHGKDNLESQISDVDVEVNVELLGSEEALPPALHLPGTVTAPRPEAPQKARKRKSPK